MKHNAKPLILALSGLLLASCGGQPVPTPSYSLSPVPSDSTATGLSYSETPLSSLPETSDSSSEPAPISGLGAKQRTFYQLLVYSFADGAGDDGVGDFKGIVDHLDYLVKLGIGGLWLSPVLDCDSYHAYDVKDYYKINPTYEKGGVTFSKLLEECHKKGIKVLMDMVLNHSSNNCAWYTQHPSWYKSPDAFGGSMKDFNYDNQELRAEIKKVGKYWLEQGADGFRLDAAKWIYNYGGTSSGADDEKNYAWWKEFYTACQAVKPDVYMIGEVLVDNNIKDDRNYYKTGMDSNFNFEMRDVVYDATRYASPNSYVNLLENFQKEIRGYNPNGIEASCLSNHDIGRFYNFNGADYSEAQLALAGFLNVLAPGDSYVYYGEEIGLQGTASGWQDMNYRTPMMFDTEKTNPNNYLYNVPSKSMSSSTKSGKSADVQAQASDSLFAAYAKAINAKNSNPSLYSGVVKKNNNGGNSEVGSFVSTLGNTSLTVVFNCGPSEKHVTFNSDVELKGQMAFAGTFGQSGKTVGMPAYSAIIVNGDQPIAKVEASAPPVTPTSSSGDITIEPDAFGTEVTVEKAGSLTLHVKDTNNWGSMKCYTWVSNVPNTNYTGSWPGSAMTKNSDWYDITLSHGATNVIFTNGSSQTADLYRNNPGEYWFVPEVKSGKVTGNWYTSNPYAA